MGRNSNDDRKIDQHGYKHQAREICRSTSYHKEEIVPLVNIHYSFRIQERKINRLCSSLCESLVYVCISHSMATYLRAPGLLCATGGEL